MTDDKCASRKPLCIDLYCGLGGWTEGFLSEDWQVVGFDIEQHVYGAEKYPGQLVIQDIRTLHGSRFRHADIIVASPPCTEFSYMAMPWTRAKQISRALRGEGEFPEGYKGSRTVPELRALFDACFRLQREANAAAGHHIPVIVENVKGAQPWVGPSMCHYGSYYLWGDIPALMPITRRAQKFNPDGTAHPPGSWFAVADSKERGVKVAGMSWSGSDKPGYMAVALNQNPVAAAAKQEGKKGVGIGSALWQDKVHRHPDDPRNTWSRSKARKAASARIAKIPFRLARYIAQVYHPRGNPDDCAILRDSDGGASHE